MYNTRYYRNHHYTTYVKFLFFLLDLRSKITLELVAFELFGKNRTIVLNCQKLILIVYRHVKFESAQPRYYNDVVYLLRHRPENVYEK